MINKKNSLSEFKKLLKPKISEEQASELYDKLVEDGKRLFFTLAQILNIHLRRALKAQKIEHRKEELRREQSKPLFDVQSIQGESDPNKVFERLVNDSKERAKSREKQEMLKQERNDLAEREAMKEFNERNSKFFQ